MKIKVKRLWNGLASVKSYQLDEARKKKEKIYLIHGKDIMICDPDRFFQANSKIYRSKFGGKDYSLWDTKFIKDEEKK